MKELIKLWRKCGFTLRLYDIGGRPSSGLSDGRRYLGYQFKDGRKVIFEGDDFGPSPLHAIDSLDTVYGLLGFLSLKPWDTDDEYFAKYTPEQLEWVNSQRCEELSMLVSDFEERQERRLHDRYEV